MKENSKKIFIYIKTMLYICIILFAIEKPITVHAIPVQTGSVTFTDHQGMKAKVRGELKEDIHLGVVFLNYKWYLLM